AAPGDGQVLLKMKCLGICGTDLHAYKGRQPFFTYPRILGHEMAAEIAAVGDQVTHLKPGDLCTVMPYRNTKIDQAVRNGHLNCGSGLAYMGVHEDGAMQEYMLFDADRVMVTNGLTAAQTAMIEPLTFGSHAVERADIAPNDTVLLVGAGPIGMMILSMGALKAARFIVTDTNEERLQFVRNKFKGVECLPANDQLSTSLAALLNGDAPVKVIDATGNRESMMKCFDYVAPGGTIVYVGLFIGNVEFYDPQFHAKEITLKASRAGLPEDFQKIIRLLRAGSINIDDLITHHLPFDSLADTFPGLYATEKLLIKAVVDY
ncbi:MAG TPA: alcohol dehydrogenase catalytic domain-containing protein, partial [Chitinophagaceae bacterium]|nr:alcohol dehydrogenase catalytic domain-containing protein [Chitinophagaceae bacterium]